MSLVLLAISLSIALGVLAFRFAVFALPVMAGIAAFLQVHGGGAGFGLSFLAGLAGAALSVALVIAILGFARNPFLRLGALGLFAVPSRRGGLRAGPWRRETCARSGCPADASLRWLRRGRRRCGDDQPQCLGRGASRPVALGCGRSRSIDRRRGGNLRCDGPWVIAGQSPGPSLSSRMTMDQSGRCL